ncbi:hypothetical protein KCP70_05035 [Salmonella enterica subsp. enterica]|nr:hypothetical protein KCP70_05035 [Salmonella enterica subsp. enterica]
MATVHKRACRALARDRALDGAPPRQRAGPVLSSHSLNVVDAGQPQPPRPFQRSYCRPLVSAPNYHVIRASPAAVRAGPWDRWFDGPAAQVVTSRTKTCAPASLKAVRYRVLIMLGEKYGWITFISPFDKPLRPPKSPSGWAVASTTQQRYCIRHFCVSFVLARAGVARVLRRDMQPQGPVILADKSVRHATICITTSPVRTLSRRTPFSQSRPRRRVSSSCS